MTLTSRLSAGVTVLCTVLLLGCTSVEGDPTNVGGERTSSDPTAATVTPKPGASDLHDEGGDAAVLPISVPGLAEQQHRGDRLRLGEIRAETSTYTSYDVRYRSRSSTPRGAESYTITGVLNVPQGSGPFPAVVLAHGYIDPAVYVRGQGMARERDYLAAQGYIALHVDYRNHAGSDDDPRYQQRMRLGYSADVINAVKALRDADDVPVDGDRVHLVGRSMGGGVVLKALIAEPGLVQSAVVYSSVSSLESENYDQFIRPDPEDAVLRDRLARRWGTPEENPQHWRANSSRPYFDRITEPILLVHGRRDTTCPPRWAVATHRALERAGVNSTLEWYDDEHAFAAYFYPSMNRIIRFFEQQSA